MAEEAKREPLKIRRDHILEKPPERLLCGAVGTTIDPLGPKVHLEGFHHLLKPLAIGRGHLDAITVVLQRTLEGGDVLRFVAQAEACIV